MQAPHLASHAARFHSLDAFDLPYETILFLDSDVLCTGNAFEATQLDGELLAAPDLSYWQGNVRHIETFVALDERRWPNARDTLPITFNAGVLVIRPALAGPTVHADLLALLDPAGICESPHGPHRPSGAQLVFPRSVDATSGYLQRSPHASTSRGGPATTARRGRGVSPLPRATKTVASRGTRFVGRPSAIADRRHGVEQLGDTRWHDAWSAFLASEFAAAGEPRIT